MAQPATATDPAATTAAPSSPARGANPDDPMLNDDDHLEEDDDQQELYGQPSLVPVQPHPPTVEGRQRERAHRPHPPRPSTSPRSSNPADG